MAGFEGFYLAPRGIDVQALSRDIATIKVLRTGGQEQLVDLSSTDLALAQEHPPIERMEGDLGAVCQVFKESTNYFLSLPGVPLAPGDQLTLSYHHQTFRVSLRVIEREGNRWRIEAPVVTA
jgi:hypothetical protein